MDEQEEEIRGCSGSQGVGLKFLLLRFGHCIRPFPVVLNPPDPHH